MNKRPIGRPRQNGRPQLKRTDVFVSAAQLIAKDGYGGTSLRKIAADLDASTASIFNLFPSKEHILNELIAFASSAALDFYERILELNLPPEVTFYKSLYEEVVAVSSAGDTFPSMFYLPELRKPEFKQAQNCRIKMVGHYRTLIDQAIESGIFETQNPALSAEQAFQLSETSILAGPDASTLRPEENALISVRFCLKGLLVDPSKLAAIQEQADKIDLKFEMPELD